MKSSTTRLFSGIIASAAILIPPTLKAVPYASGLTNNAGTISFRLNEDADNVKVIFDGGASTLDLGTRVKGSHSFSLGAFSAYQIVVSKNTGPGYPQGITNQISADTNNFVKFANGRGLAINSNPGSPNFGRIYVSCGSPGTANGRSTGDGVYILNADQTDAVGQGDTARSGGVNFNGTSQTEGPFRLAIGADDSVYITDNSDSFGTLWVTDPDVTTATNVYPDTGGPFPVTSSKIHGSILAVHPEGSLTNGDLTLYVMDEDLQVNRDSTSRTEINSIWTLSVNSGPFPYTEMPSKFGQVLIGTAAQYANMRRGPDGKWYCSQRRAAPATSSGVIIRASDVSANIWTSLQASRDALNDPAANDIFVETRDVAISPDGKYLATINNTNGVHILPVTDGIPDMTNRVLIATSPNTILGRAVAFDPAGNLYTLSSGQGFLRVYSRGGYTIATTGSDGSFDVFSPTASVSVTTADNYVTESGDTSELTFSRTGDTSTSLTINYTLTGTATNGADYTLPGTITFAAGETTTNLMITAINDSIAEFTENIGIAVSGGTNYTAGTPASVTVYIADDETPEVSVTAISPSMYERIADDYATFQLTRKGDTNLGISVSISYSGTAAASRYTGETTANLNAGDVTGTFKAMPINDALLNGNETIVATVASGSGYVIGSPNSASTTIIDDEFPTETVLFADGLTSNNSSQWTLRFGANNLVDDYVAEFGYDLGSDGIPAAPDGSTTALKLTVNKLDSTANGAAGINVYPNGQSFSGDFAMRFNMYIVQNSSSGTTEFVLAGINHSGNKTNWVRQSGTTSFDNPPRDADGLWFSIISDASASAPGDYTLFTGTNAASSPTLLASAAATSFTETFKKPPYSPGSGAGVPANIPSSATPHWADVEVKKIGNVVTLSINKSTVLEFTNNTPFTSGDVMLGYMDPYESVGGVGGAAYFSNLRVVNLSTGPATQPNITSVQIVGNNVQIDFTGATGDSASAFTLQGKAVVTGTFTDEGGASITQLSPGSFRATVAKSGTARFYRIKR